MKKKKILIIDKHQLGTLTDVYKWCYYLRDNYDVTLLCFNTGEPLISIEGVNVKYVNYSGSFRTRGIRFMLHALWNILFFNGIIMVVYFEHCDFLKRFFFKKKMFVDVRTLAVWGSQDDRNQYDARVKKACEIYDYVTLISTGVRKRLKLRNPNVFTLPLGADVISRKVKDYNEMKLLYVGTLMDREIDKTLLGLKKFLLKHPGANISYDIIGSGAGNELETYKQLTSELDLKDIVNFHGRICYNDLGKYFDAANLGVSYVPITSFFDVQPVTKTFEYANSGLFVIATATEENKKVVQSNNGVLISDTSDDFAQALEFIYLHKNLIDETAIRNSLSNYTWEKIVYNKLIPILNKKYQK